MKSLRLSPAHGLNPSLSQCFYCAGDKPDIILAGRMKDDAQAPRRAVWNMEPCDTCKAMMSKGVMLISVKNGDEGKPNPYRTGKMAVVRDNAMKLVINDQKLLTSILERRVCFVPDDAWTKCGLPENMGASA